MAEPWVKFFVGDYLRDTRGLSPTEHGLYMLALMENWSDRGVSLDRDEAFRIVGAQTDAEKAMLLRILSKFFEEKRDGFWNKKAKKIAKQTYEKRLKLSSNGRLGGQAKARKMLEQNPAIPEPEPEPELEIYGNLGLKLEIKTTEDQEKNLHLPIAERWATRFEEFWAAYPNKKGKAKARSFWEREKLDRLADQIIAGVRRYAASPDWRKDGGRFIPHPTTFLHGRRWEDEIAVSVDATQDWRSDANHLGGI